jgi:hypothetical protein
MVLEVKGMEMKNATRKEIETGEEMLADELNSLTNEHASREEKIESASDVLDDLEASLNW